MSCISEKMSSIVLTDPPDLHLIDHLKSLILKTQKKIKLHNCRKIDELRKLCWLNLEYSKQGRYEQFSDIVQDDMALLQKNSLLNILEKIKFDQKVKLSEPNRRALNLLLDLKNRQITTITLINACLFRQESRGGHYRDDFPNKEKDWKCHTRQKINQKIEKRFIKN